GFLGPIFFITLSFHVNFKILFSEYFQFLIFLTIGAILGKVLAASLSARLTGFNAKDSLIVGFGMNGRGMIEIILVVVGIELGILNNSMVSILVFIAMITTLITPLSLRLLVGKVK
ncbi:MAG: cation:proton antiporter, partial [Candidatus Margulisbacteria bacterium]|nr:cation:proton antiporter [Candidatus Margulisiibacteriota bacterium]